MDLMEGIESLSLDDHRRRWKSRTQIIVFLGQEDVGDVDEDGPHRPVCYRATSRSIVAECCHTFLDGPDPFTATLGALSSEHGLAIHNNFLSINLKLAVSAF